MEDKKQIEFEERVKCGIAYCEDTTVEEICKMAVLGCRRNPQAHEVEDCIKCECKNGMCDIYRVAEKIYEQNKDKVVLSREEYQKDFSSQFNKGYEKGSKETVMKIIAMIKDYYGDISVIARIAKQFGVEAK